MGGFLVDDIRESYLHLKQAKPFDHERDTWHGGAPDINGVIDAVRKDKAKKRLPK